MRQQIYQLLITVTRESDTAPDGDRERTEHEGDVERMEIEAAIPHHDFDSAHQWSARFGVAFVEAGGDGAGGVETEGSATEPCWEDEGDQVSAHVEDGHPELSGGFALRETVAGWEVGDCVVEFGGAEADEGEAEEPAELGVCGVCDEGAAGVED